MTATHRAPDRRLLATALTLWVVGVLIAFLPAAAWAADPARDRQWALDVIGAEQGQAVGGGAGMTIAIVDSGVDLAHEDLRANLVAGIDLVDEGTSPQDEFGHGTHVAGIVAAVGDNGRGIVGVAPNARIMPVRVLNDDGTGNSSDVIDGIRWAVSNGADVVNLSLGERGQQLLGSSLADAVNEAWEKGVLVVVAAGNEFVLGSGFDDEPALVVSATTRRDGKPDYSNGVGNARWGMAAPGGGCALLTCPREDDIFSTYWEEDSQDVYDYKLGTSMAAPHVSGAAAVLLSMGLSPTQTVQRLLDTAEDLGPAGRDSTYGEGRLDLAAAVAVGGPASEPGAEPSPKDTAASRQTPTSSASPAPQQPSQPSPNAAPSLTPTPSAGPTPAAPTPGDGATGTIPPATPSPAPQASGDAVAGEQTDEDVRGEPVAVAAALLVIAAAASVGASLWVRGRGRS